MAVTHRAGVSSLADLVPVLGRADGVAEVTAALADGRHAAIHGTWGSCCALSAATMAKDVPGNATLLVVLPRIHDVDDFALDLDNFGDFTPEVFPAWESLPQEHHVADAVFGGRLRVLESLGALQSPRVVVTSLPALLQPVPSREERTAGQRTLSVGDEIEPNALMKWLVERGFDHVPALEAPGEFSLHGGILDVYPPDAVDPLRIEFFGDEIESIRRFDVETQRKLEDLDGVTLTLVTPAGGNDQSPMTNDQGGTQAEAATRTVDRESLLDSLPAGSWIALVEIPDLTHEGNAYIERLGAPASLFGVNDTLAACQKFATVSMSAVGGAVADVECTLHVESIEKLTGPRQEILSEFASVIADDETVLLACHNEGERHRLEELLRETDADLGERVRLCLGRVQHGFRLTAERLVVLSDHELFGRTEVRRVVKRKRSPESRAIDSFLDLRTGDLVVHLTHGIGRFRGMRVLHKDEQSEEHLVVEFDAGVRVFVPVSLIHLVQKYVGAAKGVPTLSKVGGSSWARKKQRAEQAVMDLASDMIRLQAAREASQGIACPPDTHWQHEFEASFPYVETDDQLLAIADCKSDLLRDRPMDRLICGDVGFGKTEVAMRAAFKMVEAGRQVAVLVPTTVLAEQHFRTFCERMAEYPVTIEVLSRFRSKGQQREILSRMAQGHVDIVIGTHRLVQKDVRFKDLGLLVIDEEQRFGVNHKEMLKRMRLEVDVLTLSATPIPRTLHMAVLGIRDISNLVTAPQERVPIETRITRFDEHLIRSAIVRELNRGGQVYFVHNRVYNINTIAEKIRGIVPEATVGIGHGQMAEGELETVMYDFVSGKIDVLVATTIIESGLDIPNANTIFIHQADKYGLADLHQLRGRVGRYKHRAYCYLVLEEGRRVTNLATKRLKAIEEYSELGSGFRIAMRDLEIRGAGNILGNEQSGHIGAVGYELYCQLLENAVRKMRGEPLREFRTCNCDLPVSAFLPDDYVPPGRSKIEIYRKLSNVETIEQLEALGEELRDRFGLITEPTARLLNLKRLQIAALTWDIEEIRLEDGYAVFGYKNADRINTLKLVLGGDLRVVDHLSAYLVLPNDDMAGDELVSHLLATLAPSVAECPN